MLRHKTLLCTFLFSVGTVLPCLAANSGKISFHAYGVLPSGEQEHSLSLDYLTCENRTGILTLEPVNGWRPLTGPLIIEWPTGRTCDVSVVVDEKRMDTHYFGEAICAVPAGGSIACEINVCKQTVNGTMQCR